MKVLVIGSGGREHAIVLKLKQSPLVTEIFCAPGNGGIGIHAICLPCAATDIDGLVKIAKEKNIDLTVVGMEDPLILGIVDEFEKHGLKIFGPSKKAAEIEGSKVYSKNLMKKYKIPTACSESFNNYDDALRFITNKIHPLVIKADGLAAGKGVVITSNIEESQAALYEIMVDKKFGVSGEYVVIEDYLTGREISVLAFCDGNTVVPMASAQDHKRALDGDKGLNTGGMGAFSPSLFYSENIAKECMDKIFLPTVNALKSEGRPFKGVIYFGLMLTDTGVKVIEYNCRFGDPEAQVVLPRLNGDLYKVIVACCEGRLHEQDIKWSDDTVCCVMLASGGYPEKYTIGKLITGLDKVTDPNVVVYHSGTKFNETGFLTSGGRVLGITARGDNMDEAVKKAYENVMKINFENMQYRKDIGCNQ
ncbi:phosphoribosylamine--glycine ligase [Holotrichia oblita]|nr:phosphoribosylamine--glycine ligase [Holotrichia oblita]